MKVNEDFGFGFARREVDDGDGTFVGDVANGTWVLNVSDNEFGDTGNIRAFSLITTNFSCK